MHGALQQAGRGLGARLFEPVAISGRCGRYRAAPRRGSRPGGAPATRVRGGAPLPRATTRPRATATTPRHCFSALHDFCDTRDAAAFSATSFAQLAPQSATLRHCKVFWVLVGGAFSAPPTTTQTYTHPHPPMPTPIRGQVRLEVDEELRLLLENLKAMVEAEKAAKSGKKAKARTGGPRIGELRKDGNGGV